MNRFELTPIGTIHTPFREPVGMPVQPAGAQQVEGRIELDPAYAEGLADLAGFSHLVLIYRFHLAPRTELTVVPFLDDQPHGVFATRSPLRPNHLGLSVVELLAVDGCSLSVRGVDVVDGTPLLDLKPFVDFLDNRAGTRNGWMKKKADREAFAAHRADTRFS